MKKEKQIEEQWFAPNFSLKLDDGEALQMVRALLWVLDFRIDKKRYNKLSTEMKKYFVAVN